MAKSVGNLIAALDQRFPDGAPTDVTVRAQGFDYLPRHWLGRWPQHLEVPDALLGSDRKRLTRADVFAISSAVSSVADIVNLYVAMCAWGTGTKAQRVARAVRPLHERGAVPALARSLEAARSLHPVEAYRRLNTRGEDKIQHLGPAFFTKWLYFSAYDLRADGSWPAPLILDSRVAAALGWSDRGGWSSNDYGRYLDLAGEIRASWCPNGSGHVVEYSLFRLKSDS